MERRARHLRLYDSLLFERERELEPDEAKMGIFKLLPACRNDDDSHRCYLRLSRNFIHLSQCFDSFDYGAYGVST